MTAPAQPQPVLRLLDANLDRAREGLRVVEDWCRFGLDRADLVARLKDLRQRLEDEFVIGRPEIVTEQTSNDGTKKWLLRLAPDERGARHEVEMVYIPEEDRGTLCISSQVGCTLSCRFCHTGTQRLVRNLTGGDIVTQVLIAKDKLGDGIPPGSREVSQGTAHSRDAATRSGGVNGRRPEGDDPPVCPPRKPQTQFPSDNKWVVHPLSRRERVRVRARENARPLHNSSPHPILLPTGEGACHVIASTAKQSSLDCHVGFASSQ